MISSLPLIKQCQKVIIMFNMLLINNLYGIFLDEQRPMPVPG